MEQSRWFSDEIEIAEFYFVFLALYYCDLLSVCWNETIL